MMDTTITFDVPPPAPTMVYRTMEGAIQHVGMTWSDEDNGWQATMPAGAVFIGFKIVTADHIDRIPLPCL